MSKVKILHVPDCANLDLARERVQTAIARTGVDVEVVERVVYDEMSAESLDMLGSPTILVDGRDVDTPDGGADATLSCRLYRTPTGVEGAPSVEAIVAALVADGG